MRIFTIICALLTLTVAARAQGLNDKARCELRVRVLELCRAGRAVEMARELQGHPTYPKDDSNPAAMTDDQKWLAATRMLVSMAADFQGSLEASGAALKGETIRGELAGSPQMAGTVSRVLLIANGEIEIEFGVPKAKAKDGRGKGTQKLPMADVSIIDRVKLALGLWKDSGREGSMTHAAAYVMLTEAAPSQVVLDELLKAGDHPWSRFIAIEAPIYRVVEHIPADSIESWNAMQPYIEAQREELLALRSEAGRKAATGRYGTNLESQAAVEKGLKWLAGSQRSDGSWTGANTVACTSFALMAFLNQGETPDSPRYGKQVTRAIDYLRSAMLDNKGRNVGGKAYSHGIVTHAMADAFLVTGDPTLWLAMNEGVKRVIGGQQSGGSFDYNYRNAGGAGRWDLSVAGWQYQALVACYRAGSPEPGLEAAIAKSIVGANDAYSGKKFGYNSAGTGGNMTGIGTYSLQLLGQGNSAAAKGGMSTIGDERLDHLKAVADEPQTWNEKGGRYLYGWYYDTYAAFNDEGSTWRSWNKVYQSVLVAHQEGGGNWNVDGTGFKSQLATCWCILQLQVAYRYPTPDRAMAAKKVPRPEI